ncbi:hypothetical protein ACIO8G_12410 [Streptomyces sp. NPDC087219]|uniref:hypothetical protein n=1 Tax=unclassified Streptomyces TaxID=2593676 RepID=UPI003820AB8C
MLTLHLLRFLFVHNVYDYGDGDGRHYLWWVAMPVMILGGGLSPVVLIAAVVRLVKA